MSQSALVDRTRTLLAAATPAPWRAEDRMAGHSVWAATSPVGSMQLAMCGYAPFDQANAALIAEAPELLAQLCDALDAANVRADEAVALATFAAALTAVERTRASEARAERDALRAEADRAISERDAEHEPIPGWVARP